jgi:hypothetical protein
LLWRFEWEPEHDRRITQLQVYCVNQDRAYTATATTESEHFDRDQAELLRVLYSLTMMASDGEAATEATGTVPPAEPTVAAS